MPTTRVGVGSAHAKAILFGEHAVVYGAPAVAIPIRELPVRATATHADAGSRIAFAAAPAARGPSTPTVAHPNSGLADLVSGFGRSGGGVDVAIDCDIPQSRGLGSSAACARAVVLALAQLFDREVDEATVYALVQSAERVAHGTPSGIDAAATGAGRPIVFADGVATELTVGMAGVFVVADSGDAGATRQAVELVADHFRDAPTELADFLGRVTDLAAGAADRLHTGDAADVGRMMTENHALLAELGLSTGKLDRLVRTAVAAGCTGAKLSGGGLGGCVVALAESAPCARRAVAALRAAGATATWTVPTESLG